MRAEEVEVGDVGRLGDGDDVGGHDRGDRLELDESAGTAVFTGNVRVGQGALRLAADRVEVFYDEGGEQSGTVRRMLATGNVTLTSTAAAVTAWR